MNERTLKTIYYKKTPLEAEQRLIQHLLGKFCLGLLSEPKWDVLFAFSQHYLGKECERGRWRMTSGPKQPID